MRKVVIYIALSGSIIFLLVNTAKAQVQKPGITLGGNLIYARPKGNFENLYNFGGGGEVFGGIGVGKTFIIAAAGYSAFKAQPGIHSGTLTYVPVKIGIRQYILRKVLYNNSSVIF